MDCCSHCTNIEHQFDLKKARAKLKEYRASGPQQTTRMLVSALVDQGIADSTLLDIGGGVGAIQHSLLTSGIWYTTNLEASQAYLQICQEEANRQGHGSRIHHLHGNFAEMQNLPMADIVTMERVICCYPDMVSLMTMACRKARRLIGLVYPHEAWWVKLGMEMIYNLKLRLNRTPFRVYLHSTEQVHALALSHGFSQVFYQKSSAWQVVVYAKNP